MEPFSAIIAGASEVAPHVYETGLRAVQYQSYGELVVGSTLLIAGVFFMRVSKEIFCTVEVEDTFWHGFSKQNGENFTCFIFVITGGIGIVLSICSMKTLLSIWNYVGMFDPEARTIREIARMLQ